MIKLKRFIKKLMNLNQKVIWAIWVILLTGWNYTFPDALPYEDVFISVILTIIVNKLLSLNRLINGKN